MKGMVDVGRIKAESDADLIRGRASVSFPWTRILDVGRTELLLELFILPSTKLKPSHFHTFTADTQLSVEIYILSVQTTSAYGS
jgi:hypothetical protein